MLFLTIVALLGTGRSVPITGSDASEIIRLHPGTAGRNGAAPTAEALGRQSDSSSSMLTGASQSDGAGSIPQLSSTPILGGPGTVQVESLAFTGK